MWLLKDHSALKQVLCVILMHWGLRTLALDQMWVAGLQPLSRPVSMRWDPRISISNTSSSCVHKTLTQGPHMRNMSSAINSEQEPWVQDWHRLGLPPCERHLLFHNSFSFPSKGAEEGGPDSFWSPADSKLFFISSLWRGHGLFCTIFDKRVTHVIAFISDFEIII